MQIKLIDSLKDFDELKDKWNHLLLSSRHKSFFLTWQWQYHWWEHYHSNGQNNELFIITCWSDDDELKAVFPLYRMKGGNACFPSLDLLYLIGSGHESSEYLDIICHESMDESHLYKIFEYIKGSGCDGISLSDLREESVLLTILQRWADDKKINHFIRHWKICPYLPLEGSYDNYLNSLSKNMRYNVNRRTRNINKTGEVSFRKVNSKDEIVSAVDCLFDLHGKRWEFRKESSGFNKELRKEFHKKIAASLFDEGFLRFFFLEINSKPIAALYCFFYDDIFYYYQAGLDPEWDKYSAGLVLMNKVIESAYNEGAREFDFLRGAEPYKFKWTSKMRKTFILEAAFTVKANVKFATMARARNIKRKVKGLIEGIS